MGGVSDSCFNLVGFLVLSVRIHASGVIIDTEIDKSLHMGETSEYVEVLVNIVVESELRLNETAASARIDKIKRVPVPHGGRRGTVDRRDVFLHIELAVSVRSFAPCRSQSERRNLCSCEHLPDCIFTRHAFSQIILVPYILKCAGDVQVGKQLVVCICKNGHLRRLTTIVSILSVVGVRIRQFHPEEGNVALCSHIALEGPP